MRNSKLAAGALLGALAFFGGTVQAQATRTWVSGVGDDANPCSRTAPCKTFAGAISKTAAGGEIDALDPGGYGAVTITKSITIDGGPNAGGILAANTTGVIINAAGISVTLRRLAISGGPTTIPAVKGVRIIAAARVNIEDSHIQNFAAADPNGRGVSDERVVAGELNILRTTLVGNRHGIVVASPSKVTLLDVATTDNLTGGVVANGGARVSARNCTSTGNSIGFLADGSETRMMLTGSTAAFNNTGVGVNNGAMIMIGGNHIFGNALGMDSPLGTILSYGDNQIDGNTSDGVSSGTINGS